MKINFKIFFLFLSIFIFGLSTKMILAQDSTSVLYVPVIGITTVPSPLTLPAAGGDVTYNYAVKNFLQGAPLTGVQVTDTGCSPVKFVTGDDNNDSKLDYNETWRYTCTTHLTATTQSTALATGFANNVTAAHQAYSTVVVGSEAPAPLVSIVNTTGVTYPEALPAGGENVTYTYKVNNPGIVPLSNVTVIDDKCNQMSGELGDTNGNQTLDSNEVWIYTCTTFLKQTTTDTATVTATGNGLKAVGSTSFTINVSTPVASSSALFDISISPLLKVSNNFKIIVWGILAGILSGLTTVFFLTRRRKPGVSPDKKK